MKYSQLLLLVVFMLLGTFFLGGGITGMVISESCCFGEGCAPENRCVDMLIESPVPIDNLSLLVSGLFILLVAGAILYGELKRRS